MFTDATYYSEDDESSQLESVLFGEPAPKKSYTQRLKGLAGSAAKKALKITDDNKIVQKEDREKRDRITRPKAYVTYKKPVEMPKNTTTKPFKSRFKSSDLSKAQRDLILMGVGRHPMQLEMKRIVNGPTSQQLKREQRRAIAEEKKRLENILAVNQMDKQAYMYDKHEGTERVRANMAENNVAGPVKRPQKYVPHVNFVDTGTKKPIRPARVRSQEEEIDLVSIIGKKTEKSKIKVPNKPVTTPGQTPNNITANNTSSDQTEVPQRPPEVPQRPPAEAPNKEEEPVPQVPVTTPKTELEKLFPKGTVGRLFVDKFQDTELEYSTGKTVGKLKFNKLITVNPYRVLLDSYAKVGSEEVKAEMMSFWSDLEKLSNGTKYEPTSTLDFINAVKFSLGNTKEKFEFDYTLDVPFMKEFIIPARKVVDTIKTQFNLIAFKKIILQCHAFYMSTSDNLKTLRQVVKALLEQLEYSYTTLKSDVGLRGFKEKVEKVRKLLNSLRNGLDKDITDKPKIYELLNEINEILFQGNIDGVEGKINLIVSEVNRVEINTKLEHNYSPDDSIYNKVVDSYNAMENVSNDDFAYFKKQLQLLSSSPRFKFGDEFIINMQVVTKEFTATLESLKDLLEDNKDTKNRLFKYTQEFVNVKDKYNQLKDTYTFQNDLDHPVELYFEMLEVNELTDKKIQSMLEDKRVLEECGYKFTATEREPIKLRDELAGTKKVVLGESQRLSEKGYRFDNNTNTYTKLALEIKELKEVMLIDTKYENTQLAKFEKQLAGLGKALLKNDRSRRTLTLIKEVFLMAEDKRNKQRDEAKTIKRENENIQKAIVREKELEERLNKEADERSEQLRNDLDATIKEQFGEQAAELKKLKKTQSDELKKFSADLKETIDKRAQEQQKQIEEYEGKLGSQVGEIKEKIDSKYQGLKDTIKARDEYIKSLDRKMDEMREYQEMILAQLDEIQPQKLDISSDSGVSTSIDSESITNDIKNTYNVEDLTIIQTKLEESLELQLQKFGVEIAGALKNQQNTIESHGQYIEALIEENGKARKKFESEKKQLVTNIEKLQTQINQLKLVKPEVQPPIPVANVQNVTNSADLKEIEQTILEQSEKVRIELQQENEKLFQEIKELGAKVEKSEKTEKLQEALVKTQKSVIEELTGKIKALGLTVDAKIEKANNKTSREIINAQRKEIQRLEVELDKGNGDYKQVLAEVKATKEQINALDASVSKIQGTEVKVENNNNVPPTEIKGLEKLKTSLNKKLEELKQKENDAKQDRENLKKQIQALGKQIKALGITVDAKPPSDQSSIVELQKQLSKMKQEYDKKTKSLGEQIKSLSAQIFELSTKPPVIPENTTAGVKKLQAELDELKKEHEALVQKNVQLQLQQAVLSETNVENKRMTDEKIEKLKEANEKLETKINDLRTQKIAEYNTIIGDTPLTNDKNLIEKLKEAKKERKEILKELNKVTEKVEEKGTNAQLQNQIKVITKDIATIKTQNDKTREDIIKQIGKSVSEGTGENIEAVKKLQNQLKGELEKAKEERKKINEQLQKISEKSNVVGVNDLKLDFDQLNEKIKKYYEDTSNRIDDQIDLTGELVVKKLQRYHTNLESLFNDQAVQIDKLLKKQEELTDPKTENLQDIVNNVITEVFNDNKPKINIEGSADNNSKIDIKVSTDNIVKELKDKYRKKKKSEEKIPVKVEERQEFIIGKETANKLLEEEIKKKLVDKDDNDHSLQHIVELEVREAIKDLKEIDELLRQEEELTDYSKTELPDVINNEVNKLEIKDEEKAKSKILERINKKFPKSTNKKDILKKIDEKRVFIGKKQKENFEKIEENKKTLENLRKEWEILQMESDLVKWEDYSMANIVKITLQICVQKVYLEEKIKKMDPNTELTDQSEANVLVNEYTRLNDVREEIVVGLKKYLVEQQVREDSSLDEKSNAKLQKMLDELIGKSTTLDGAIDKLNSNITALYDSHIVQEIPIFVKEKEEMKVALQSKLDDLTETIGDVDNEIQKVLKRLKDLGVVDIVPNDNNRVEGKRAYLDKLNKQADNKVKEMRARLVELRGGDQSKVSKLNLEEAERLYKELTDKKEKLLRDIESKENLPVIDTNIDGLILQLDDLNKKLTALLKKETDRKKKLVDDIFKLTGKSLESKKITELEIQLEKAKGEFKKLKEEYNKLTGKDSTSINLSELKTKVDTLRKNRKKYMDNLSQFLGSINEIKNKTRYDKEVTEYTNTELLHFVKNLEQISTIEERKYLLSTDDDKLSENEQGLKRKIEEILFGEDENEDKPMKKQRTDEDTLGELRSLAIKVQNEKGILEGELKILTNNVQEEKGMDISLLNIQKNLLHEKLNKVVSDKKINETNASVVIIRRHIDALQIPLANVKDEELLINRLEKNINDVDGKLNHRVFNEINDDKKKEVRNLVSNTDGNPLNEALDKIIQIVRMSKKELTNQQLLNIVLGEKKLEILDENLTDFLLDNIETLKSTKLKTNYDNEIEEQILRNQIGISGLPQWKKAMLQSKLLQSKLGDSNLEAIRKEFKDVKTEFENLRGQLQKLQESRFKSVEDVYETQNNAVENGIGTINENVIEVAEKDNDRLNEKLQEVIKKIPKEEDGEADIITDIREKVNADTKITEEELDDWLVQLDNDYTVKTLDILKNTIFTKNLANMLYYIRTFNGMIEMYPPKSKKPTLQKFQTFDKLYKKDAYDQIFEQAITKDYFTESFNFVQEYGMDKKYKYGDGQYINKIVEDYKKLLSILESTKTNVETKKKLLMDVLTKYTDSEAIKEETNKIIEHRLKLAGGEGSSTKSDNKKKTKVLQDTNIQKSQKTRKKRVPDKVNNKPDKVNNKPGKDGLAEIIPKQENDKKVPVTNPNETVGAWGKNEPKNDRPPKKENGQPPKRVPEPVPLFEKSNNPNNQQKNANDGIKVEDIDGDGNVLPVEKPVKKRVPEIPNNLPRRTASENDLLNENGDENQPTKTLPINRQSSKSSIISDIGYFTADEELTRYSNSTNNTNVSR